MLTYSTWHLLRSHFCCFCYRLRCLTFFVSTDAYRGDAAEDRDLVTCALVVFESIRHFQRTLTATNCRGKP